MQDRCTHPHLVVRFGNVEVLEQLVEYWDSLGSFGDGIHLREPSVAVMLKKHIEECLESRLESRPSSSMRPFAGMRLD